jgi:hypothetical protein
MVEDYNKFLGNARGLGFRDQAPGVREVAWRMVFDCLNIKRAYHAEAQKVYHVGSRDIQYPP